MIEIRHISAEDDLAWNALENLFAELYAHMDATESPMLMPLTENGEQSWVEDTKAVAGRFAVVVGAYDGDLLIGFGYGSCKLAPAHLGGVKVGSVNHFYVKPENRRSGAGSKLLGALEDWFKEQEVSSIELEVTYNNSEGKAFWNAMGYQNELIQLRKPL